MKEKVREGEEKEERLVLDDAKKGHNVLSFFLIGSIWRRKRFSSRSLLQGMVGRGRLLWAGGRRRGRNKCGSSLNGGVRLCLLERGRRRGRVSVKTLEVKKRGNWESGQDRPQRQNQSIHLVIRSLSRVGKDGLTKSDWVEIRRGGYVKGKRDEEHSNWGAV